MINLLKCCLAPPSSAPTSAEERVDAQARALETLEALDNVFGGLTLAPAKVESDHRRSVSEWSTELDQPTSEILADPAASSPCNGDPNTVVIFHQGSLEYEYSSASDSDSTSTTTSLSSLHDSGSFDSTPSDTKIRFASTVSVVEIPSHRDMPRDIVESVWTATHELHHNGRRSVQEWNWDGRDWANALEEHEMIYDPTTGAYIHPATWHDMEREREEEEAWERERRMQELELERLHQAMEEAVQREQIRIDANRKMKIKERRRRKTRRQTSPKAALVKKMVSPKISTRRSQPIVPIVEPAIGGSLTRFADT